MKMKIDCIEPGPMTGFFFLGSIYARLFLLILKRLCKFTKRLQEEYCQL